MSIGNHRSDTAARLEVGQRDPTPPTILQNLTFTGGIDKTEIILNTSVALPVMYATPSTTNLARSPALTSENFFTAETPLPLGSVRIKRFERFERASQNSQPKHLPNLQTPTRPFFAASRW